MASRGRPTRTKHAGVLLVAGGLTLAAVAWMLFPKDGDPVADGSPSGTDRSRATVERVVDGDTLYVSIDGERTRVRLLNVDAPEIPHPGKPGECFGAEATRFLETKLPPGSKVDLEYDLERFDRYGRTLAGVTYQGEFINETLVTSGYAKAMKVQPNIKFYEPLRAAQRQAEHANAGMFDPANSCR